jgi:PAS domain S-box-containing protein
MTFRDRTARAAVEDYLRNNAALAAAILDSAKHAFVGMDSSGRITEWNRQAEITFGRTREDVLGRDLAETMLADEFQAGLTWFLPGGRGNLNRRFESRAVDRDGREFPIELALWEVDSEDGTSSFHALVHDISERRHAEDAVRVALSSALAAVAQMPQQSVPAPGRVLIVDDYPINRLVATTIVKQLGYQVDGADNGAQAITAVQARRYDVILMDCVMPDVDGYETTRRIRGAEGPNRHTPIIALTSTTTTGERDRCLAAGMNDYVAKPFDPAALSDALARCLAA